MIWILRNEKATKEFLGVNYYPWHSKVCLATSQKLCGKRDHSMVTTAALCIGLTRRKGLTSSLPESRLSVVEGEPLHIQGPTLRKQKVTHLSLALYMCIIVLLLRNWSYMPDQCSFSILWTGCCASVYSKMFVVLKREKNHKVFVCVAYPHDPYIFWSDSYIFWEHSY